MHIAKINKCTKLIDEFVQRNWNTKISHILKENKCMYIEHGNKVEIYLVQTNQLRLLKTTKTEELLRHTVFAGIFLGTYWKENKEFIEPSLELGYLALLNNAKQNVVYVNTIGEKLFLYGRDLFAQSINSIIPPIRYKSYVIILNSNGEYLGLGMASTSIHSVYYLEKLKIDNPRFILIKNYIDLGWYLRHGG